MSMKEKLIFEILYIFFELCLQIFNEGCFQNKLVIRKKHSQTYMMWSHVLFNIPNSIKIKSLCILLNEGCSLILLM